MNCYDMEFITIQCGHEFCIECIKTICDSSIEGKSTPECPTCDYFINGEYISIINQSWKEHIDWL